MRHPTSLGTTMREVGHAGHQCIRHPGPHPRRLRRHRGRGRRGALNEKTRGDKLARFFSIASKAAIFFTVLALLYQVTHSEEDARRASYADLLATYHEINQLQIDNPAVWRMVYPGEADLTRMGEDERLAIQDTYFVMNFFERLYLSHQDGVIDDTRKTWESWITYSFSSSTLVQTVWDEGCGMYHADFVAYVEENFDDGACGAKGAPGDPIGSPTAASRR
jgi:hypothetical protein